MARQISEGRKAAYYFGLLLQIGGLLLFLSNFWLMANDSPFQSEGLGSFFGRALGGMGLMALGAFVRKIGSHGVAGSGTVLDPERARQDLEPYSRMAGGMVKDALEEARLSPQPAKVVIRCRACGKLNEEDSKFCQECAKPM